jgi:uncharacterized protein HemX
MRWLRRSIDEKQAVQSVRPGLYDADSLIYLRRQVCLRVREASPKKTSEEKMKAFLVAVIVALGMGIGAYTVLEQNQIGATEKFSSGSTRL